MTNRMVNLLVLLAVLAVPALGSATEIEEGARLGKTCAGCHGTAGASPGQLIPVIGGQVEPYLLKALAGFRNQERPGTVMLNIAKGYDEAGLKAMALWFSTLPWEDSPHSAGAEAIEAGAALVKGCTGCHGASGHGMAMFPRLAGQAPEYLLQALEEYREGKRAAAEMTMVRTIPEADLTKIALYYSALK